MCGIAGYAGKGSMREGAVLAALRHRGPDGEGVWHVRPSDDVSLSLLHTRLKVIDLSEKAAQPMRLDRESRLQPADSPEESRLVVTYNGEIHNYRELREELAGRGHKFEGAGDTEVLVRGFSEWGSGLFGRIDGMFALAIYDAARRRLVLARDHAGIKPLYHARTADGGVCFASETRALLASGLVDASLDSSAIVEYLETGSFREPATLHETIRSFPAGHFAEVSLGDGLPFALVPHRYWSVEQVAAGATVPAAEWNGLHQDRLVESVRSRLSSDVPMGIFLSGGIDSTLLLEQAVKSGGCDRIRAFTLGGGLTERDEIGVARATAGRLGVRHEAVTIPEDELSTWVRDALSSPDLPSADGVNLALISRAARARGLVVVLGGTGADELHGDYGHPPRLAMLMRAYRKDGYGSAVLRRAGIGLCRLLRGGERAARLESLLDSIGSVEEVLLEKRRYFGREEIAAMFPPGREKAVAGHGRRLVFDREALLSLPLRDQVRAADVAGYLRNTLLRDGDAATMAHGQELRVPYLGRRYMECVLAAPEARATDGGGAKPRLVEMLSPEGRRAAQRPKVGFNIDMARLLGGAMKEPFIEAVDRLNSRANFRLNKDALLASLKGGADQRRARRLWALLSLGSHFARR